MTLATAEYLLSIGQKDRAKIVLDQMKPFCVTISQIDAIGKHYADLREFKDTLELAFKIYKLASTEQTRWEARVNIIRAYLGLNLPVEALNYIKINEAVDPHDHPNRMDWAMALFLLNRKDEGEAILRKILTEDRTQDIDNRVKFNLGTYDLANGDFKVGLRKVLLEGRKLNIWQNYSFNKNLYWEGGAQPGKTILLCAEGGIGDEIISVRFQKHFRDLGMRPVWFTDRKDLAVVFNRCGFETITDKTLFRPDWLWTYSMLSPVYLNLEEDDLWDKPYLSAIKTDHKLIGNKKIGIKCGGNPKYDQDLNRNVDLNEMIAAIPDDWTIYSFHVDEKTDHPRVTNLQDVLKSWDDTLSYMDQMDVVLSTCTSAAHAAASTGVKTFVVTPILNYYTWAKKGNSSRWYGDNLTLFKQTEPNDWTGPLQMVRAALQKC